MYVSSYLTLQTALSGVEAAQEEMDTTGQNISNVNTPDYEEQTVDLTESTSLDISGSAADGAMQLGEGVTAASVSNASDPYLDAAWRQTNASTTAATTTQSYLNQIQNALGSSSSGTGINTELSTFWSDWNTLADNPTSAAAQEAVVNDGQTLAQSFNSLSQELNGSDPLDPGNPANASSILGQVNTQYRDIMSGPTATGSSSGGTLYNDAYQIASLNQEIVQAQGSGQSANSLIDQRNAALDSLSSLGNVQVQNNTDGSVTVYFGGVTSQALVSDPTGLTSDGTLPPGDNFGSYAEGSTAATGWVGAFQDQYATAGAAADTAAQLASTVGGQLGALIGLAGYSYTPASTSGGMTTPASGSFGNLGVPSTGSGGATEYADPVPATALGTIGTVSASLDSVAQSLITEVNNPTVDYSGTPVQTSTGTTPASSTTPPISGAISLHYDFFVTNSSSASDSPAANISVSSSLLAAAAAGIQPGQLSASNQTNTTGSTNLQVSTLYTAFAGNYSSDNDVALDEANNSGGSADSAYAAFVQQVGSLAQSADDTQSTQSALKTQVTNQRQSAEGVDLSQEMANLITEQQAYQASAKVMNAFSTVMDSLMSVMGQ